MKKILSVLCVLAFVASFACIGVSADDATATFSLVAAEVAEGETTLTVDLVANLADGAEVAQAGFLVTVPENLTLTKCEQKYMTGSFITSQTIDTNPYMILWVVGTASLPVGETVIATLTFDLPADAAEGDVYDLTLAFEPDNGPANISSEDLVASGAAAIVASEIKYVAEAPATEASSETPTETESEAPATEAPATEAPAATTTAAPATTTTEAPATTKAPAAAQTGDMMFVVAAVMVVALGAAVVVKKVNVK